MNEDALKMAGVALPENFTLEARATLHRLTDALIPASDHRAATAAPEALVTAPVSEELLQAHARIAELEQALADLVEAVRDSMDSEG